ncbi:MAG: hypothetical protein GY704_10410, partial [Phycisphaeraceae bacterium]|nr:hypothetical protein [Phycisphaeraceae bacterium]
TALDVLARAEKWDDIYRRMNSDPSPSVRVRAARLLAEAEDGRALVWLIVHFGDGDLVDWAPFVDSPRATRLEAARAYWRITNRRFDYVGEPLEAEWCRDLALEDSHRFRASIAAVKRGSADRWFETGCRQRGITLGKGKTALRTLTDILAGDHPRFLKENALAQLRKRTGQSILAISIPDLEILAPGETHPVFAALAWRWRDRLDG